MSTTEWEQQAGMTGDIDSDNVQDLVDQAEDSKDAAAASETAAASSATSAATSATDAANSATSASSSASDASTSETNAATSAASAASSATSSASSASAASTSESNAATSASAAAASESAAGTSETNAATSATNAASSASDASGSAGDASTSAAAAATSASAAAASESAAASSESAASTSETNAANSATSASTSATNAANSETNASTSATNAATSETNAATSASNAATSATAASTSATAAQAAQAAAEAAQEAIDGTYLGALASDPTVDGNGDAVTTGDWYYNTTDSQAYIYNGSSWDALAPDLVGDATPQLGGDLDTNGNAIKWLDNNYAYFGTGGATDMKIWYNGSNGHIEVVNGALSLEGGGSTLITNSGSNIISTQGDSAHLHYAGSTKLATTSTGVDVTGNVTVSGTVDGRDVASDGTKLDGIETGATADQTASEIKTAYESNADTNAFTDAEQTKLSGIEASADVTDTTNVTAAGALMDSELTSITAVKALDQGVATTDSPTFVNTTSDVDLTAISASISDTAVDVFVYDTRKDSDGGAWRKRTQHTSWYNETLNTSYRGSRKEFPAVAVIVVHGGVAIYDGDDPDMPMWMEFPADAYITWASSTDTGTSCVSALNGKLFIGNNLGYGDCIVDFVADDTKLVYNNNNYALKKRTVVDRTILESAEFPLYYSGGDGYNIINNAVNDVAMTVLPNAPIDSATGLPVPTIAVATDGGVSVIKDDGTVVDSAETSAIIEVAFDDSDTLFYARGGAKINRATTYTSDGFGSLVLDTVTTPAAIGAISITKGLTCSDTVFRGCEIGLEVISPESTFSNSMISHITSSYNTGWMNGDIKLATLSDTDDTDVTGSELVTNGTFDTDTSGWSAGNGATLSVVSNQLAVTPDGSTANAYAGQTITCVVGETYTLSYYIDSATNNTSSFAQVVGVKTSATHSSTSGNFSLTFTATSTSHQIRFYTGNTSAASICYWDNISVRLAEEDRSVNGNGLQVFGTVTKNPVATGADLVAYSGFSSSNYLVQPYNSDIATAIDNESVCINFWFKQSSGDSNTRMLVWGERPTNSTYFGVYFKNDNELNLYSQDAPGGYDQLGGPTITSDNIWRMCTAVRDGTSLRLYINGELSSSLTCTNSLDFNLTSTGDFKVFLGFRASDNAYPYTGGHLALVRISGTVPSAEQIAKIYEDEKALFQENAQATLYGSSDAVTALAYDDDTELLHVGTSAGRSDFSGLRRVSNTTDAVGAAISASNGLIAED